MQKPYVVGRNDGGTLQKTSQDTQAWFETLEDAEQWIEDQKSVDPKGVDAGEYYIDGPCEHDWILNHKLQVWYRVAQYDNRNRVSAFEYCANAVDDTRDSKVTFVRKGAKGFKKLYNAYFD